jgi:hypothetical protein
MHTDVRDIGEILVFHVLKELSEKKYKRNGKMEKKYWDSPPSAQ